MSGESQRLVSVQILRGLAALLVAVFHLTKAHSVYWDNNLDAWSFGAIGVDIFFIISGFVMALTMEKYRERPGDFLWHRYLRIAPLYYIIAAEWALIMLATHKPASAASILSNLTIVPLGPEYVMPVLAAGWTLSFEFILYAIVCAALLFKKGPIFVFVTLCALASVGLVWEAPVPLLRWFTHPILFEFALGVLAFVLRDKAIPIWLAVVGCTLLLIQAFLPVPFDPEGQTVVAGVSMETRLLLWGVPTFLAFNAIVRWMPKGKWVPSAQLIGDSSYSIYLTHVFVVGLLLQVLPRTFGTILGLIAVILLGIACYLWLERPLLKLKDWRPIALAGR